MACGLGSNECDRRATGCMHGTDAAHRHRLRRKLTRKPVAANKGGSRQDEGGTTVRQISKSGRFRHRRCGSATCGGVFCKTKSRSGPVPCDSDSPTRSGWFLLPESPTGLLVTDRDVSLHLSHEPTTLSHYNNLSNAGIGALVGGAAGMWLLSYPSRNEHWRETGLLAGQAALNSLVAVEALKYSLGRERPLQGDGAGHFFQGGTSFPSEHAAAAWAVAGVIGHEYPGPVPKLLAYGLASLVSYSRIRAEQHFPADVFVGSIVGSLIAQQVYSHHHDPELGGDTWRYDRRRVPRRWTVVTTESGIALCAAG